MTTWIAWYVLSRSLHRGQCLCLGRAAVRVFHEKESSQLLELNAYTIPLCALGGGRGAVATRHFGAAIAHYARRMRLPGAMLTVSWLHGRAKQIKPSDPASGTVSHAARLPSGRIEDAVRDADAVVGRGRLSAIHQNIFVHYSI